MKTLKPTTQYIKLDQAFQYYNQKLFKGELPDCLITFQKQSNSKAYYGYSHYTSKSNDGGKIDEIALNPVCFDRDDKEILSTLVHEMVHHWQYRCAQQPKAGYHNYQWANMMKKIGLMPSDTGEPGGKMVGYTVTHYVIPGGAFDRYTTRLLQESVIDYKIAQSDNEAALKEKEKKNKTKYACPECGIILWGKPTLNVICGDCDVQLEEF